ncbi:hypothetical protein L5515_012400 [Caenorhabditis briggsae]|uniref:Uncharacterized protein n=1 Tax=Caenorhabditis briggsae TaxID=6238 RepID=A0AAE9EXF0_CAEBR|nr:hypothetical protein L5515_012400 [Caenorhabditis briggsae]
MLFCLFYSVLLSRTTPPAEQSFNKTEPAPKIAAKVQWSIESVCKYGRRLDFSSNEPNAAFVNKTLSKEIHGYVLSMLTIHPLKRDEVDDSELGPFLNTFNNSVKAFRKQNPHEVLLSKENSPALSEWIISKTKVTSSMRAQRSSICTTK